MINSLWIAKTGMEAQQTQLDVISHNLANTSTTGYKRASAVFQDLIYQNLRRVGSNSSDAGSVVPAGAQVGLGVKTAAIYRINEQGNLQQTSNAFDLAIRGNGFFQVTLPSGDIVCEEFEGTSTDGVESFDDLVAVLDDVQPDSAVEGVLHYRLKKGSTTRVFDWTGPGAVSGSAEAMFTIRT